MQVILIVFVYCNQSITLQDFHAENVMDGCRVSVRKGVVKNQK